MARHTARIEHDIAPKQLSRRVLVLIKRDQTTATPRPVWQHELPLLEAIYGEGNAVIIDPDVLDEGYSAKPAQELLIYNKTQDRVPPPSEAAGLDFVFIGSPAIEYERLAAAYGRHPEVNQPWVENVYGRFQEGKFSAVIGSPSLEDLPKVQLRGLVRDFLGSDEVAKLKDDDLLAAAVNAGVEVAA